MIVIAVRAGAAHPDGLETAPAFPVVLISWKPSELETERVNAWPISQARQIAVAILVAAQTAELNQRGSNGIITPG